jgi:methylase of polypeptide subunit release factors
LIFQKPTTINQKLLFLWNARFICSQRKKKNSRRISSRKNWYFRRKSVKSHQRSSASSFLESIFEDFAYEDRAFPILAKQTISHPSTVAEQTELLEVNEKEKILEIGTGSGYQTAVLVAMNAFVYTIERQKELHDFAQKKYENCIFVRNFKVLETVLQVCLLLRLLIKFS